MRNGLILFKTQGEAYDGNYIEKVTSTFADGGFGFSKTLILACDDDLGFSRSLKDFKDTADNLVVVYSKKIAFDAKKILSEVFDSPLVENENASRFVQAVAKADDTEYSEDYALLPADATLIPNVFGAFQGFILDDREFTVAMLPGELKELKVTCDKYILPYLEKKYNLANRRVTLKYFGDRNKLESALIRSEQISEGGYSYFLEETNGDFKVQLLFTDCDKGNDKEVIRFLISELKDDIYAEFDTTLSERLFDLLKLKNLKLSVAESFTGGRVISSVISNPGASAYVHEGIVSYSNESKLSRLDVGKGNLIKDGAVSSVIAYRMAVGLLKSGGCDLAVSTTGIAGPKSDSSEKPVGLCYIAVGMKDGVHTYKYNFEGTREEITETAKNTALFLTIKKLKGI